MSDKVKWETFLSAEDHAHAELQRKALGLSRAAYTRAALGTTRVIKADNLARAIGLLGRGLFGVEQLCSAQYQDIDISHTRDVLRDAFLSLTDDE